MEKQKRIQELETEFKKELSEYGASYEVLESTMQGNTKLNGKHLRVILPAKVKVAEIEIAKIVESYYGKVFGIGNARGFSWGHMTGDESPNRQEIVLNLEPGYDPNEGDENRN